MENSTYIILRDVVLYNPILGIICFCLKKYKHLPPLHDVIWCASLSDFKIDLHSMYH